LKTILPFVTLFILIILITACSSENNSFTSKAYHNTTAHYNGYFYAREELRKIENTIWQSLDDDYNKILRLYPALDSSLAKGYEKEIQEAVKMASIAIQRHPNSKWADDCYILVGNARLYSLDWGNAIQTYKFVNTKSKDPDARHKAIIQLVRTFTEHKEFNNAQAAIDFVQKEELSKVNRKSLLLEKAYFYQVQGDYDNMVRNLSEAYPYLRKKDRPGRIYFITGQVYQKLGFEAEAYNYYKKCLATNPEYEVDFYARLYLAQVAEISRSRSLNAARKSFKKLLKDSKNKDFKDKIYYEMGVFELKQKNVTEAIANLNRSIREGNNKNIDGEAYLRLGEIYYDTLRNYERSQAYYDSAIGVLPKDYEGYAKIKARQEVLNEFVKHLNTIKWQDSLLLMAGMDSLALRARIDSSLQAREKADAKKNTKQKKKSKTIQIDSQPGNVFSSGEDDLSGSSVWYFGNPSAMAAGQTEFKRIWGEVVLEDNWRRSMRSSATIARKPDAINSGQNKNTTAPEETTAPVDPVAAEFDRISKELPRTPEQKEEALKKIEDAYFALGDIYHFKLEEDDNAVSTYHKLLDRFPKTEYEPEVLYKLYLITKDTDPARAEQYATQLKTKFPESTFTKILINPNFLAESSQAMEKQKELYRTAYEDFQNGNYASAHQVVTQALNLGSTSFTPNLTLLSILIAGKTETVSQYQYLLDDFIKKNPDTEVGDYAKKLLEASRQFELNQEKKKGIQYIRSLEEPHYFVIVHRKEEKLSDAASIALEKFNEANFNDLHLRTSSLELNDEYALTLVAELPRVTVALGFIQTFNTKVSSLAELRNHKFDTFVITKDNFDIFYRTKGLDEYLQFFEKNYPKENQ